MDINSATILARTAMDAHGLEDWTLEWDSAKLRWGVTIFRKRVISMSRFLVTDATRDQVLVVAGHEIAHAVLGPGYGHGIAWKRQMISMGLKPSRLIPTNEVQRAAYKDSCKWTVFCSISGKQIATRHRRSNDRCCLCHRQPVTWEETANVKRSLATW